MHASEIDFVSVLSEEERCAVCSEIHAVVDQRACVECGASMCPDCARLRPDTSWICAPCTGRRPTRAIVLSELRSSGDSTRRMLALRGAQLLEELAPTRRRLVLHLSMLGNKASGALWAGIGFARRATARHSASTALSVRHHAKGFVLATALLVAIARSEHDAR